MIEVHLLDPHDVVMLERQRTEIDADFLAELKNSIYTWGQLSPCLVRKEDMTLIAGGTRLQACKELEIPVRVLFHEECDDLTLKELELEENIRRKDLTWQDELNAVSEIHRLKITKYGQATGGTNPEGWSQGKTAELTGRSRRMINMQTQIAEAAELIPELLENKSLEDAHKALLRAQEEVIIQEQYRRLEERRAGGEPVANMRLIEGSCMDPSTGLPSLSNGIVGCFCMDPPFGIALEDVKRKYDATPDSYQDPSPDELFVLLKQVFHQCYRVARPDAYLYCFFGWQHYNTILELLRESGWQPWHIPLVWYARGGHDRGHAQCRAPSRWPASTLEPCFYARKGNPSLTLEGQTNLLEHYRVTKQEKFHPTQKPVELLVDLLQRVEWPGMTVCDPFAGSGSTLMAAHQLGHTSFGWELDPEYYKTTSLVLEGLMQQEAEDAT